MGLYSLVIRIMKAIKKFLIDLIIGFVGGSILFWLPMFLTGNFGLIGADYFPDFLTNDLGLTVIPYLIFGIIVYSLYLIIRHKKTKEILFSIVGFSIGLILSYTLVILTLIKALQNSWPIL